MKTLQALMFAMALLSMSPTAMAQDFMDALKQTAEMHNEANNQSAEETDETRNTDQLERENEYRERWRRYLREAEENFEAELTGLGPYENCIAMMIIYLDLYYKLEDRINNESDCKKKYDLYGMQLLGISASNTIMYCPEKVSNLHPHKQEEVLMNVASQHFKRAVREPHWWFTPEDEPWPNMLDRVHLKFTDVPNYTDRTEMLYWSWVKWIWEHFHPATTIHKILEIGQKMEALGCSG